MKERHKALPAELLQDANNFIPPAVFSRAARLTFGFSTSRPGRPTWNLVISNVPGPQFPLYMAGARLEANYPGSVITDGMGLNITVMSYMGHMDFGIVADRDQMPDLDVLMGYLREELEALEREREPPPRRGRRHTRPARAPHLRRLPRPGEAARRPAPAERARAPRRAAVHHPAPDVGAVDAADHPRARRGARAPRRRRPRPGPEGPRARQADPAPAVRAVGRAVDADPERVREVPRRPRPRLRLPVAAVPDHRVPARQQEPRDARGLPPRRGRARAPGARARGPEPLRRVPAPPRPPRLRGPGRLHRARLLRAPPPPRGPPPRLQGDLRRARSATGRPTRCARS